MTRSANISGGLRPHSTGTPAAALLLLAGLLAVAAVGGWAVFITVDYARSLRESRQELIRLAGLLEEHGHRTVEAADLALRRLAERLGPIDPDLLRGSEEMFEDLRKMTLDIPEIGAIAVLNARGEIVASSLSAAPLDGNFADRDYFQVHATGAAGGGGHVGELTQGRFTGQDFFSVSRPLRDRDEAFHGVLLATLTVDYFQTFYRSLGLGIGGTAGILRSDGTLLVREPLPDNAVGLRIPQAIGTLTPEAPVEVSVGASPLDGVRRIVVRRLMPEFGLVVLASRSVQEALAGWRQRAVQTALVGAAVILAGTLLLALGLRSVARQHAMEGALRDARGELERRVEERTASLAEANASLERTVAQRDLLLREVYHRVKNNMQQVDALIAVQLRSLNHDEAKRALQDIRLRINALGTVHQQLLQSSDHKRFSLRGFLEDLCSAIALAVGARPRGIALLVDADDAPVDLDLAIPLGLLVNEWVNNAFRHAFPEGQPGTVVVQVRHERDHLVLKVSDDGIGYTRKADRPGATGTRIVEALARQLRAEATVEAGTGTTCVAAIPLKEEVQHA